MTRYRNVKLRGGILNLRRGRVRSKCILGSDFSLPVVHYVGDDGGEEAEQHDCRAGIHDRVQKLPRVLGERQHLLQILRQKQKRKKKWRLEERRHKYSIIRNNQEVRMRPAR